jgi:hypothetical protein
MHVLNLKSGLIHRKDCDHYSKGGNDWVEIPKQIATMLSIRLSPAWKPSWIEGSLGCCIKCKPHEN